LQVDDGVERAAADSLVGNQSKPTFDLIEPGAVSGREVQMEARTARQPGAHPRMLMGRIVIADQMNVQFLRDVGLDMSQKGEKFLVPGPRLALGKHAAVGHIKGGEQRGRAVAYVVVRDALDVAQTHRQERLCTLKR